MPRRRGDLKERLLFVDFKLSVDPDRSLERHTARMQSVRSSVADSLVNKRAGCVWLELPWQLVAKCAASPSFSNLGRLERLDKLVPQGEELKSVSLLEAAFEADRIRHMIYFLFTFQLIIDYIS